MKSLLFVGVIVLSVLPDINEAATFSECGTNKNTGDRSPHLNCNTDTRCCNGYYCQSGNGKCKPNGKPPGGGHHGGGGGLLRRLLYPEQQQIPQQQMSPQINQGKVYKCDGYGELCVKYFDGCNHCTCTDANWLCTQMGCKVARKPKCTKCIFGYVPDIDGECRQIPQQKPPQQNPPKQIPPKQIPPKQIPPKQIPPQQYIQYKFVLDDRDFSEYSDVTVRIFGYCDPAYTDNSFFMTAKNNGEIFNELPECVYDSFIFSVSSDSFILYTLSKLVGSTRPWNPRTVIYQYDSFECTYTGSLPVIENKEYWETFEEPGLPAGTNEIHFTVTKIGGEDC